jgi:hypothetical protein
LSLLGREHRSERSGIALLPEGVIQVAGFLEDNEDGFFGNKLDEKT